MKCSHTDHWVNAVYSSTSWGCIDKQGLSTTDPSGMAIEGVVTLTASGSFGHQDVNERFGQATDGPVLDTHDHHCTCRGCLGNSQLDGRC